MEQIKNEELEKLEKELGWLCLQQRVATGKVLIFFISK